MIRHATHIGITDPCGPKRHELDEQHRLAGLGDGVPGARKLLRASGPEIPGGSVGCPTASGEVRKSNASAGFVSSCASNGKTRSSALLVTMGGQTRSATPPSLGGSLVRFGGAPRGTFMSRSLAPRCPSTLQFPQTAHKRETQPTKREIWGFGPAVPCYALPR